VVEKLKRETAGRYRSADGRFTVEQSSGRWMLVDEEQHDELGLSLVRGPFATLEEARDAIDSARTGPAPTSDLAERAAREHLDASKRAKADRSPSKPGRATGRGRPERPDPKPAPPKEVPVELRRYERGDGKRLRALWGSVGFKSVGDDDDSLDLMADRNPGLLLVAEQGDRIVGSALGAWDGRRGWIYHVATSEDHRREGLGRRIVHEVERKLRALGCPRVNVVVRDDAKGAMPFWKALGYADRPARQLGKDL
jgi:ribosomal protein S18 acetylase RimI-like enzyme